jgi:hypothetical protein
MKTMISNEFSVKKSDTARVEGRAGLEKDIQAKLRTLEEGVTLGQKGKMKN